MILGQESNKELLDIAVSENLPALLVGDTGTGKTSLIRELADKYKKTYTRFSITGETTVDDFVGKYILKNGETKWQDGILLTAVKKGHFLVVDEINAALPEILFVLHSLLDDDKYVIVPQKDNETVRPHKDFRFFATMNPVDEYAGTKELNKAFHSRFAMVLHVDYPPLDIEIKVVQERTKVTQDEAQKMVDIAVTIRKAKQEEKVFYTMSTRDLIYWGGLIDKIGIHRAFRVAVRNKATGDEGELEKMYQKVFTDYERDDNKKLLTSLDSLKAEWKQIDTMKKSIRATVEKEVRDQFKAEKIANDKEKEILAKMEERLKEKIRKAQDKKLKV